MRKHLVSTAVLLFLSLLVSAQSITPSVINAAGTTFKVPGENFHLDWSIAEMTLVNTMKVPAPKHGYYVITNGYLQPDNKEEGDDKAKTSDAFFTATDIKLHPNPTVNNVEVSFFTSVNGKANLLLFNSMGQQVYSKSITVYNKGTTERISMGSYTQGTYMLYIVMKDANNVTTKQGSFMIVKL